MRKVRTKFGVRIRCICPEFNYDLPPNFVVLLSKYDLDEINYENAYFKYIGRNDDAFKTIIIKLLGMPRPNAGLPSNMNGR